MFLVILKRQHPRDVRAVILAAACVPPPYPSGILALLEVNVVVRVANVGSIRHLSPHRCGLLERGDQELSEDHVRPLFTEQ
eukprot:2711908-Heterocapsa_arctica.AAC.1